MTALTDQIARIEARGVELPEVAVAVAYVGSADGYLTAQLFDAAITELLAALDEATATADAMEDFIDGCDYYIRHSLPVTYGGPRLKRGTA